MGHSSRAGRRQTDARQFHRSFFAYYGGSANKFFITVCRPKRFKDACSFLISIQNLCACSLIKFLQIVKQWMYCIEARSVTSNYRTNKQKTAANIHILYISNNYHIICNNYRCILSLIMFHTLFREDGITLTTSTIGHTWYQVRQLNLNIKFIQFVQNPQNLIKKRFTCFSIVECFKHPSRSSSNSHTTLTFHKGILQNTNVENVQFSHTSIKMTGSIWYIWRGSGTASTIPKA